MKKSGLKENDVTARGCNAGGPGPGGDVEPLPAPHGQDLGLEHAHGGHRGPAARLADEDPAQPEGWQRRAGARVGLSRIVVLYDYSFTSYQIH